MQETNIEQLVINRMTQEQYDAAKEAGTLNDKELYMTPASGESNNGLVLNTNGDTVTITQNGVDVTATIKRLMLKDMTWADLE